MKKKQILLANALVGVLGIAVFTTSCSKEEEAYRSIKIQKLDGSATISRNNKDLQPYNDMALKSGDVVNVGENSSLIFKMDEDKYVKVNENTRLSLEATGSQGATKTKLVVVSGGVIVDVKQKLDESEEFSVNTPNSAMAIRGTLFGVDVDNSEDDVNISYSLFEGETEVSVYENNNGEVNKASATLTPGKKVSFAVASDELVDINNINDNVNDLGSFDLEELEGHLQALSFADNYELTDEDREAFGNAFIDFSEDEKSVSLSMATMDIYIDGQLVAENVCKYSSSQTFVAKITLDEGVYDNPYWSVNNSLYYEKGLPVKSNTIELTVNESMIIYPYTTENKSTITVSDAFVDIIGFDYGSSINLENTTTYSLVVPFKAYVTATEKEHKKIVGWLVNGEPYIKNGEAVNDKNISLTVVGNMEVCPVYEDLPYSYSITFDGEMYVGNDKIDNYYGSYNTFAVTLYANPKEHQYVEKWLVNGIEYGENGKLYDGSSLTINVYGITTVEVCYVNDPYTVNLTAVNANITVGTTEDVKIFGTYGQAFNATIKATTNNNVFLYWLVDGEMYYSYKDNDRTLVRDSEITLNITKDTVVEAVYSIEGLGTVESPFLVKSAEDLKQISIINELLGNVCYAQTASIDLSNIIIKAFGSNSNPFIGEYNGNKHSITGLIMSSSSKDDCAGLFGNLKGTVYDLNIINASVSDKNSYCGILASVITNSTVKNVSVSGNVSGDTCGGLAGLINTSYIENAIVNAIVNSATSAGALASNLVESKIVSSNTTGSVYGTYNVGGFVGYSTGAVYENCIAKANVYVSGDIYYTSFKSLLTIENDKCKFAGSFIGKLDVSGRYQPNSNEVNQIRIIDSQGLGSVSYYNAAIKNDLTLENSDFANCFIGRIIVSDTQPTEIYIKGCKTSLVGYTSNQQITLTKQSSDDFGFYVTINYSQGLVYEVENIEE